MFWLNKIPADSFAEADKVVTSVAVALELNSSRNRSMVVSVDTSCSVIKMNTF